MGSRAWEQLVEVAVKELHADQGLSMLDTTFVHEHLRSEVQRPSGAPYQDLVRIIAAHNPGLLASVFSNARLAASIQPLLAVNTTSASGSTNDVVMAEAMNAQTLSLQQQLKAQAQVSTERMDGGHATQLEKRASPPGQPLDNKVQLPAASAVPPSPAKFSKPLIPGGPCENPFCGVVEAPQWRRIEKKLVCNRCGMYYHRHSRFPDRTYFKQNGISSKHALKNVIVAQPGGEGSTPPRAPAAAAPPAPLPPTQQLLPLQPQRQQAETVPQPQAPQPPAPAPAAAAPGCGLANAGSPLAQLRQTQTQKGGQPGPTGEQDALQRILAGQAPGAKALAGRAPVGQAPAAGKPDLEAARRLQALLGERLDRMEREQQLEQLLSLQQQQRERETQQLQQQLRLQLASQGRAEAPASPHRGKSPGSPHSDTTIAGVTGIGTGPAGAPAPAAGGGGVPAANVNARAAQCAPSERDRDRALPFAEAVARSIAEQLVARQQAAQRQQVPGAMGGGGAPAPAGQTSAQAWPYRDEAREARRKVPALNASPTPAQTTVPSALGMRPISAAPARGGAAVADDGVEPAAKRARTVEGLLAELLSNQTASRLQRQEHVQQQERDRSQSMALPASLAALLQDAQAQQDQRQQQQQQQQAQAQQALRQYAQAQARAAHEQANAVTQARRQQAQAQGQALQAAPEDAMGRLHVLQELAAQQAQAHHRAVAALHLVPTAQEQIAQRIYAAQQQQQQQQRETHQRRTSFQHAAAARDDGMGQQASLTLMNTTVAAVAQGAHQRLAQSQGQPQPHVARRSEGALPPREQQQQRQQWQQQQPQRQLQHLLALRPAAPPLDAASAGWEARGGERCQLSHDAFAAMAGSGAGGAARGGSLLRDLQQRATLFLHQDQQGRDQVEPQQQLGRSQPQPAAQVYSNGGLNPSSADSGRGGRLPNGGPSSGRVGGAAAAAQQQQQLAGLAAALAAGEDRGKAPTAADLSVLEMLLARQAAAAAGGRGASSAQLSRGGDVRLGGVAAGALREGMPPSGAASVLAGLMPVLDLGAPTAPALAF